MKDKNPYPFESTWWLTDINVRSCNLLTRSIFIDLICLISTSEKYGYLIVEGKNLTFKDVSDYTSVAEKQLKPIMIALLEKKLLIWDDKKEVYFCPLMIERKRKMDRHRYQGSKGGNPLLVGGKAKEGESTDIYISKKKRKLRGVQLRAFNMFWQEFGYQRDKAGAADAWIDLKVNEPLYNDIIKGARQENLTRKIIIENGDIPITAQGWLSGKKWENIH